MDIERAGKQGLIASMFWSEGEAGRVRDMVHAATSGGSGHLNSVLLIRAMAALDDRAEADLEFSENRSGYLEGSFAARTVLVPFNLVAGLAPAAVLSEILAVGEDVSAAEQSRLCLSGSSASLGQYNVVSDIDFCEYAVTNPAALAARVSSLAGRDQAPYLMEVKINERHLIHPWDGFLANAGELLICPNGAPARTAKLDFVGNSTTLGQLPVTNLVLPIHPGDEPGPNTGESFPFQEVVVLRGGIDVLSLSKAGRYGEYVSFLRGQMRQKVQSDPIKALKRAISLFRLLGIESMTSKAVEMVNDPVCAEIVMRKRGEELAQYAKCADPKVEAWLSSVSSLQPAVDGSEQAVRQAVASYVGQMTELVDELFAPYEAESLA